MSGCDGRVQVFLVDRDQKMGLLGEGMLANGGTLSMATPVTLLQGDKLILKKLGNECKYVVTKIHFRANSQKNGRYAYDVCVSRA